MELAIKALRWLHWLLGWRALSPSAADRLALKGVYTVTLRDAATGAVVSEHRYDNVICTVGKNFIASLLNQETGQNVYNTIFAAVGTSGTAPAAGDTQLGAETFRNPLAIMSRNGNVLTWQAFYTTSQANATLAEAGIFLNGGTGANTGTLLSHVAISESKTSSVTLTLSWTLTIG